MEKFTKAFVTKEVFSMGSMMCGVMSAEGEMFVAFVRDKKQAEEFFRLFGAPELSSRPTAGITTSHVRK